jgi:hypothetical protein
MRAGHQDQIFEGGNTYLDREYPNWINPSAQPR